MGDGDMISNMVKFQVHKNEYRRGIGASGIRAMSRDQLRMGGEMIQSIAPDISMNEAQRMYAMSMGLNPDQAKTLVGGGRGGGGGGGGGANGMSAIEIARAAIATQEQSLSGMGITAPAVSERRGFTVGRTTAELAATGAIMGKGLLSIPGAAIGAGAGLLIENFGAIKDLVSSGGMTKREAEAEIDRQIAENKQQIGYLDVADEDIANFASKDLSGSNLSFIEALKRNSGGKLSPAHKRIAGQMIGMLRASGAKRVDPTGANAIEFGDNEAYGIDVVQRLIKNPMWRKEFSGAEKDAMSDFTHFAGTRASKRNLVKNLGGVGDFTDEQVDLIYRDKLSQAGQAYRTLATGGEGGAAAGDILRETLPQIVGAVDVTDPAAKKARDLLLNELNSGNIGSPVIHQTLEKLIGEDLPMMDTAGVSARVGGFSLGAARDGLREGREKMLLGMGGLTSRYSAASSAGYLSSLGADLRKEAALKGGAAKSWSTRSSADVGEFAGAIASQLGKVQSGGGVKFIDALERRTEYEEFRTAVLAGDKEKATQKWQVALRRAGGETKTEVDMEVMGDPYARVKTREETDGALLSGLAKTAGNLGVAFGASKSLEKMQTKLNSKAEELFKQTTSPAEEAAREGRKGSVNMATEKRRGSSPLQRAAGFGAKEEAMTSIVRSIRRLEKSVKTTDANVEKTAAKVNEWF